MPTTPRLYFVLFLASLSLAGSTVAKESIAEKTKTHWSFQPVIKPALPPVKDTAWPRTGIDQFILAKLESKNIAPSPQADAGTLIRRAYSTLTGLPPSHSEVTAFITESAKNPQAAWAALVDRLLASPQYGERWGRYWLDIARYADSKGYVFQEERRYPFAYTYRDWVVKAINDDLPYDQFITYQLAADKAAININQLVYAEKTLRGSIYGTTRPRTDLITLIDMHLAGQLILDELVTSRHPLTEINEAYAALQRGEVARSLIIFE